MKATALAAALAALLLCSCSSSYVFQRPYRDVVDASLEECRRQQVQATRGGRSRRAALTYSAGDHGDCYDIRVKEVYGLEKTRIRIKPKGAARTQISVRSERAELKGVRRDRENEQIWIYRIGTALRRRPPAASEPFRVQPEE